MIHFPFSCERGSGDVCAMGSGTPSPTGKFPNRPLARHALVLSMSGRYGSSPHLTGNGVLMGERTGKLDGMCRVLPGFGTTQAKADIRPRSNGTAKGGLPCRTRRTRFLGCSFR